MEEENALSMANSERGEQNKRNEIEHPFLEGLEINLKTMEAFYKVRIQQKF